jgi:hypothetical protein
MQRWLLEDAAYQPWNGLLCPRHPLKVAPRSCSQSPWAPRRYERTTPFQHDAQTGGNNITRQMVSNLI